tara:strand:+ start:251 stop:655 length:405 start_codon:yes stop_codon:yes gene_type:complete
LGQKIIKSVKHLLRDANQIVTAFNVEKCKLLINNKDFVFVDLRDYREILKDGKIPGAFSCPRGMLEFWIDPDSPYHKDFFNQDKTYIFYCASAWRSALAVKVAMEMGLNPVVHLEGGFSEWLKKGGTIEIINKK